MSFTNHHQDCVRRRVIRSVMARPSCQDEAHADKVVNEVWDSCFRDTRPFDEVYR
jgi:inner membrane protease ATP23